MWIWILLVSSFASGVFGEGGSALAYCFENMLLRGFGSRSPFFGDVMSFTCYDFKKKMFGEITPHQGVQTEGGMTAKCDKDEDVIASIQLQIEDARLKSIDIECASLLEPEAIEKMYTVSSDTFGNARVACEASSAMTGIHVEELEGGVSRVSLDCVMLEA